TAVACREKLTPAGLAGMKMLSQKGAVGIQASVCQIDSVGSQANRMEPIFKREPYNKLVPQVIIKAKTKDGDKLVNLLDAGHRAADAIVRFSDLASDFEEAYRVFLQDGNAEPLAKLAPTSIVFGSWDSRVTQAKLPRIVRSVIRAFNVKVLHRSAQYIPPLDYVGAGLLEKPEGKQQQQQDAMSELGLAHAPAPWSHGGVQVSGVIRRDATLNLEAIRALGSGSQDEDNSLKLRRYILGLSLVSLTAPQETSLREGCQLVQDSERGTEWNLVKHDGHKKSFNLSHGEALEYAKLTAESFGVGDDRTATFDVETATEALRQAKGERKVGRRRQATAQTESEADES
ncbi:MAG TPA: type I-U CRISPR-associated protein Cas7, partial [Planctomycetaceae bacterium]|nr:type I-U CRISPR-associated protein Cas7 [Planctomycetaceae bacterium]